jgi:hypothetical protein
MLIVSTVVCGAIYGAVLGSWHGARLAVYVAIKIPLLMLSTAAITATNWIVATPWGCACRIAQTFGADADAARDRIDRRGVARAGRVVLHASPPRPRLPSARCITCSIVHVVLIASAGIAGARTLRNVLIGVCGGPAPRARRALRLIVVYAFVGGEVAWALRPFVGSVFLPVVFLRDDALNSNVYEFILTDILPPISGGRYERVPLPRSTAPESRRVAHAQPRSRCSLARSLLRALRRGFGFFQGGWSIGLAVMKVPLIILGSLALCVPSLYCSLPSREHCHRDRLRRSRDSAASRALLLLALMPVIWLFSVSTLRLPVVWLRHGVDRHARLRTTLPRANGGRRARSDHGLDDPAVLRLAADDDVRPSGAVAGGERGAVREGDLVLRSHQPGGRLAGLTWCPFKLVWWVPRFLRSLGSSGWSAVTRDRGRGKQD